MAKNCFITRNGLIPDAVWPSKYGGWYIQFGEVCVTYCFDFTISTADVWNRVAKRELVPGELDIVQLPADFDIYPEDHWHCYSYSIMVNALIKRNLIKNLQLQLEY